MLGNVCFCCNNTASFLFISVLSASKTEEDTETKADGGEDKDESNKVSSSQEARNGSLKKFF